MCHSQTVFPGIVATLVFAAGVIAGPKDELIRAQTELDAVRGEVTRKLGAAERIEFETTRNELRTLIAARDLLRIQSHYSEKSKRVVTLAGLEMELKGLEADLMRAVNSDLKAELTEKIRLVKETHDGLLAKRLDKLVSTMPGIEGRDTLASYADLQKEIDRLEKKLKDASQKLGGLADELQKREEERDRLQRIVDNDWVLINTAIIPEGGNTTRNKGVFSVGASNMVAVDTANHWTMTYQFTTPPRTLKPGEKVKFHLSGTFDGVVPETIAGPIGLVDVVYHKAVVLKDGKRERGYLHDTGNLNAKGNKETIGIELSKGNRKQTYDGTLVVPDFKDSVWAITVRFWNTPCAVNFEYRRAAEIAPK